jgi:hypothetical protein
MMWQSGVLGLQEWARSKRKPEMGVAEAGRIPAWVSFQGKSILVVGQWQKFPANAGGIGRR